MTKKTSEALIAQPLYTLSEAARLSRIPASTLKRWLIGHHRTDAHGDRVEDLPVLRIEMNHDEEVTWGEFVEAVYLRAYRSKDVPLPRLRRAIIELREEKETAYPLATKELLLSGSELYRRIEDDIQGAPGRQLAFKTAVEKYLQTLEFEFTTDGFAIVWRPVEGDGLVRISPQHSFGVPVVDAGVRTEILTEAFDAGHGVAEISELYGVPVEQVEAAMRYEGTLKRKAAPVAA